MLGLLGAGMGLTSLAVVVIGLLTFLRKKKNTNEKVEEKRRKITPVITEKENLIQEVKKRKEK